MSKIVLLKAEKDFAHHRFKKSFSSPSLRLRFTYTTQNTPRFGFIIPKKVLSKATDRNKVKRRLKTILERHVSKLMNADILFFPQKQSLRQTLQTLEDEITNNFTKLRLWKSSKG